MTGRTLDRVLIVALVIVGVVLLFSLVVPLPRNRATAPSSPDAASSAEATQADGTRDGPSDGSSDGAEASDTETDAEAEVTPVAPSSDATQDATPQDPAPTEADPEPQPGETPTARSEDGLELERIGFSFATGGAGACGVALEPWAHVALSRDLLEVYPCGSEVTVVFDEAVAGRERVRAVVADTMGSAAIRTVNVYIAPDEPANDYGVRVGFLEP